MRKALLLVTAFLVFTITLCGCAGSSSQLPHKTTYDVETNDGFQFAFHYEKEEPIFEFVSPSGKTFKEGSDGLQVERAEQAFGGSVYFLFENGEIGEWIIHYDRLSNPKDSIELFYAEDYVDDTELIFN